MSTDSPIAIDGLSLSQKLALMERLWEDLTRRPADIESPAWHGQVLAERRAAVEKGQTEFIDWNDAKRRLRDRLS